MIVNLSLFFCYTCQVGELSKYLTKCRFIGWVIACAVLSIPLKFHVLLSPVMFHLSSPPAWGRQLTNLQHFSTLKL